MNTRIAEGKVIVEQLSPEMMDAVSEGSGEIYMMQRDEQREIKDSYLTGTIFEDDDEFVAASGAKKEDSDRVSL